MNKKALAILGCVLSPYLLAGNPGMLGFPASASAVAAEEKCYKATNCDGSGCIPIPTSLPPVGNEEDQDGWKATPESQACGVRRAFLFFFTPCGPPLASEACISVEEEYESVGGPDD